MYRLRVKGSLKRVLSTAKNRPIREVSAHDPGPYKEEVETTQNLSGAKVGVCSLTSCGGDNSDEGNSHCKRIGGIDNHVA
jgi:hypothetical protein